MEGTHNGIDRPESPRQSGALVGSRFARDRGGGRCRPGNGAGVQQRCIATIGGGAVRAGEHAAGLVPISKDALEGAAYAVGLARIYARVGEADRALDLLEELLSIPSWVSVPFLRLNPVWGPPARSPPVSGDPGEVRVKRSDGLLSWTPWSDG